MGLAVFAFSYVCADLKLGNWEAGEWITIEDTQEWHRQQTAFFQRPQATPKAEPKAKAKARAKKGEGKAAMLTDKTKCKRLK